MKKKSTIWWGTYAISENETHYWQVGPLFLGIERKSQEWRVASMTVNNPEVNDIVVNGTESPKNFPNDLDYQRYVFHQTNSNITLTPILADRAQVSRPEIAFYLPAQEQVTIYVSSPIWVRVEAGASNLILTEIPSLRLSDTWYGPNTREGELCYSSKTFCRTHLDDIPLRPHRVLTPVSIRNNSKEPLLLEQLSLPLPYLSTFVAENGSLWTEEIIVVNEPHHKHNVHHEKGPPRIAEKAKLVSAPRHHLRSMNFITLFYNLLTD